MSKPVGELVPEPEPSPINRVVNDAATDMISSKPEYTFDGQNSPSLKVIMPEEVALNYRKLCPFRRNELEYAMKDAMANQAFFLDRQESGGGADHDDRPDETTYERHFDESRVMMNHQPLLFYPPKGAMVKGAWQDQQLVFESYDELTDKQRHVILGGLATFMTFVNNQNL